MFQLRQATLILLHIFLLTSGLEDTKFWFQKGDAELESALKLKWNTGIAKNVVLFVGDGMSPNTITAARIYKAKENSSLLFERFPHVGVLKTYSVDQQTSESASTATALFSGVKANSETVGVDANVEMNDCAASLVAENRPANIMKWAQDAGKATGFVTTTSVTDATPSALYAHTPNRWWECDTRVPAKASACKDIARQLVEDIPGTNLQVIMGGGRSSFIKNDKPESPERQGCWRSDGKDLLQQWEDTQKKFGMKYKYLETTGDLNSLDTNKVDFVFGLFADDNMKAEHERDKSPEGTPSLSQMTEAAVQILLKNENGFVLMVEGGLIDDAHHKGHAREALDETVAFEAAIKTAIDLLKANGVLDSTLVIVTSDHSHSLAINGVRPRGSDILGTTSNRKADELPYTALLYSTGGPKNFKYENKDGKISREDPSTADTTSYDYYQQATVLGTMAEHDAGDVLIYAMGPQAHLFHNLHEQNYVAHVIAYAAKIGHYDEKSGSSYYMSSTPIILVFNVILILLK